MKKGFKILIYSLAALLFIITSLFFLLPNRCESDFKVYSEKGHCEFSLKTCEGLLGCKEYNNVQVPCGSVSTLCGEKVLCDCDDTATVDKQLQDKTWTWEFTSLNDEKNVIPHQSDSFTITFHEDGVFYGTTDCNYLSGQYRTEESHIKLYDISFTEMYCEGSQEAYFVGSLAELDHFIINDESELRVFFKNSDDYMVFFDKNSSSNDLKWEAIKSAVDECEVKEIGQTHSRKVTAELKDGAIIEAYEPNIDEVFNIVDKVEHRCGKVLLWTE